MKPGSSRSAGPPRGRAGRAQPDAPPGLPQIGLRRGLSGARDAGLPVQLRLRRLALPPPGAAALEAGRDASRAARSGFVEQSVGAATHYHADYVAPYWAPLLAKIAQARRAHLLSLAGRLGLDRGLHRPLYRRAADPLALRPPLRQAVLTDGTLVPVEDPALAGPPIRARGKRCRRPARHVEGLDAQHSRCRPKPDRPAKSVANAVSRSPKNRPSARHAGVAWSSIMATLPFLQPGPSAAGASR